MPAPADASPTNSKLLLPIAAIALLAIGFAIGRGTAGGGPAPATSTAGTPPPITPSMLVPPLTPSATAAALEIEPEPSAMPTLDATEPEASVPVQAPATREPSARAVASFTAPSAAASSAEAIAPFSKDAANAALAGALGQASGCKQPGDPSGTTTVTITFAPSGRVTAATLSGPPFQGTSTGSCIAKALRSANMPPFSGEATTVTKQVSIR